MKWATRGDAERADSRIDPADDCEDFATDLEDWPAILRAMEQTGEEFRQGGIRIAAAGPMPDSSTSSTTTMRVSFFVRSSPAMKYFFVLALCSMVAVGLAVMPGTAAQGAVFTYLCERGSGAAERGGDGQEGQLHYGTAPGELPGDGRQDPGEDLLV